MKAVILCAGKGTRLGDLTREIPKVMVPFCGKPLLQYHLEWLRKCGAKEVFINLHYLPEVIEDFFKDGSRFGVRITYSYEKELQGTAGALRAFQKQLKEDFLVHYGDIYSEVNVGAMMAFHGRKESVATLIVQPTPRPHDSDIVVLGDDDRVEQLQHAPGERALSNMGNAACYILAPIVFDYISQGLASCDFVQDVFPKMISAGEKVFGYRADDFMEDIGTIERCESLGKRLQQKATWTCQRSTKMLITQTPLRISFMGGGTDLEAFYSREPGIVLSATIDKYVYITVHERYDEQIILGYSQKENVSSVDQIKHELIRESMKMTEVHKGVEISVYADIPSTGSGLGSSSTFTVGLLNALYQYKGRQLAADWLAQKACEIEIDKCGAPIGKQDQYAAAYGGINTFEFLGDGKVCVENIDFSPKDKHELNRNLMMFYTNITRKSSSILETQRKDTGLKLDVLREMKNCVTAIKEALLAKEFDDFGRILHKGWELKKELSGPISTPEINDMYAHARNAGALGGKI